MMSGAVEGEPFMRASLVKYWSCSASMGMSSMVTSGWAASNSPLALVSRASSWVKADVFW